MSAATSGAPQTVKPPPQSQPAPQKEAVGAAKKPYVDLVRRDGVIKEQIRQEELTRRSYNRKWGHMKNLNGLCLEIAKRDGIPEETYQRHMALTKQPEANVRSTWNISSSEDSPNTTSGEVGWRSSRPECNLERLGPLYISPRHTLIPPGAEGELPISSIILG